MILDGVTYSAYNSMSAKLGTDHEIRESVVFRDFGGNDYRLRPFTVKV